MVNLQEVSAQACKMWYVISPGNGKNLMTVMTIASEKYGYLLYMVSGESYIY